MPAIPQLLVHSVDKFERRNRAVQPFVRLFTLYNQVATAGVFLAVPIVVLLLQILPLNLNVVAAAIIVEACALLAMVVTLLLNVAVGLLDAVAATVLIVLLVAHAFGNRGILYGIGFSAFIALNFVTGSLNVFTSAVLAVSCIVIAAVFLLYLYWRALVAIVTMFRMSDDDRTVLRRVPGRFLRRLLGLPPTLDFIPRPRALVIGALGLGAALLLGTAAITFTVMPMGLSRAAVIITRDCWRDPSPSLREACAIGAVLGVPFIAFVVVPLFFVLGSLLQRMVWRLSRLSLERVQRADLRPPILFLRAFRDDQIELRRPKLTLLGWLLEYGNRKTNLDRLLLEEGTPYGPVVAIGNPKDDYPPYGAARGYFDNKTWQQAVASLAQESTAVVICVDNTEGIWWEIKHLASNDLLGKALFIIHPRHAREKTNAEFAARLLQIFGHSPSETEFGKVPVLGVFRDSEGALHIALSSTFSQTALLFLVRLFLRGKLGMDPWSIRSLRRGPPARTAGMASLMEPASFPEGTILYDAIGLRIAVLPDDTVLVDDGIERTTFPSVAAYRAETGDRETWLMLKKF